MLLSFSRRSPVRGETEPAAAGVSPRERERLAAVARFAPHERVVRAAAGHAAQVAATLLGTVIGLCTLVDAGAVRVLGAVGLDGVVELPLDPGFCLATVALGRTWQVERADLDRRTRAHPLVTGPLKSRFYAGAPLITSDGFAVGTLAALDRESHSVGPRELAALEALADLTVGLLERAPVANPALDESTGLPARRSFDERLDRLSAEAAWGRTWGAVAALDVEGLEGELGLRSLAEALRARIEGEGEVFRIGASEFAIVAGVGATYDAARIRTWIEAALHTVRLAGYDAANAHVGIVASDELAQPRLAFRLADWRMYAEKLARR